MLLRIISNKNFKYSVASLIWRSDGKSGISTGGGGDGFNLWWRGADASAGIIKRTSGRLRWKWPDDEPPQSILGVRPWPRRGHALALGGPAAAADLKLPVKAPYLQPLFDWTGFYIGAHAGFSRGTSSAALADPLVSRPAILAA